MRRLLVCALLLAACTDTSRPEESLEVGDLASYQQHVQPYLGIRCGSLDCHGDMKRALRIYAENGLRKQDQLRFEPLALGELSDNLTATSAWSDFGDAKGSLLLTKALPGSAGGIDHQGDPIWLHEDESGYRCILSWLMGAVDEAACAEALAEVDAG